MKQKELLNELQGKVEIIQNEINAIDRNWEKWNHEFSDKWNAAQCLEHLNFYFRHYNERLLKTIQKAPLGNSTELNYKAKGVGGYLINILKGDRKLKTRKRLNPFLEGLSGQATLEEFDRHLKRLPEVISRFEKKDGSKMKIRIDAARLFRMTALDMLHFNILHAERHWDQAKRALDDVK